MRRTCGTVLIGLLCLVWLASCGVAPDYSLTVIMEDGISGTPAAGRHIFKEFTTVNFEYTPDDLRLTVEVILNKRMRYQGFGSVIMYGDAYELEARMVDIRGTWEVTLTHDDGSISNPPPYKIWISGPDMLSGNFSDERGYNGTWTAINNFLMIVYYDWEFYTLRGRVFDMGSDAGFFRGGGLTGNWKARRLE